MENLYSSLGNVGEAGTKSAKFNKFNLKVSFYLGNGLFHIVANYILISKIPFTHFKRYKK
jgi:hypothetical protein